MRGGERDAARMEYEELLRNQPTNRTALVELANLEVQTGNTGQARQRYLQLLQINPKDPVAQVGLIEIDHSHDRTAYEAQLKTMATLHNTEAFIPFKLGNLYASQNRWSEARHAYQTALKKAQQNNQAVSADYAFNLAIALEQTQQPQVALKQYKEAKQLASLSTYSFDPETLNSRIHDLEGELQ